MSFSYEADKLRERLSLPPSLAPHYYGNTLRVLMIVGGVIMLGTLPFFIDLIEEPIFVSLLSILALSILAGIVTPRQRGIIIIDTIICAAVFLVFEYRAVNAYREFGAIDAFFAVNQLLALIFFLASYFGTKTVRWFFTRRPLEGYKEELKIEE